MLNRMIKLQVLSTSAREPEHTSNGLRQRHHRRAGVHGGHLASKRESCSRYDGLPAASFTVASSLEASVEAVSRRQ
jgi:hypothetical protein